MTTIRTRTSLIASTVLAAAVALSTTPAHAATSPNRVGNPGAEAGAGSAGGPVASIPKWTFATGKATVVTYGSPGFPSASTPGPAVRGTKFFAGGKADGFGTHVLSQMVDLSAYASKISTGTVDFDVSAWLGGKGAIPDSAMVEVFWKAPGGQNVGSSVVLGPVTKADRANTTRLIRKAKTGDVPVAARYAFMNLIFMDGDGGYSHGYADNVVLKLKNV